MGLMTYDSEYGSYNATTTTTTGHAELMDAREDW